MKQFYLIGIVALGAALLLVLAFALSSPIPVDPVFKAKVSAARETELIFKIRSAQTDYENYLKGRLAECQREAAVLSRDQDGILVCASVNPQNKLEEKK